MNSSPISPATSVSPQLNKQGEHNNSDKNTTIDNDVTSGNNRGKIERESFETRRAKTNAATLQANVDVSLGTKNEPMALLYKAALEGINEALEPSMGKNAAEKINESGIDVSPEATAERIVNFSTAFFGRYQEQHQDMSLDAQLDSFLELVGGGVDQGFREAREILDGLGVLDGELEANIDRTYDLVFEGFDTFRDQQLGISSDTDITVESAPES